MVLVSDGSRVCLAHAGRHALSRFAVVVLMLRFDAQESAKGELARVNNRTWITQHFSTFGELTSTTPFEMSARSIRPGGFRTSARHRGV
jgi:hypothetical protein